MKTKTRKTKAFKVAAISSNRNGFGLRGVVILAKDGTAWEFGSSDYHLPTRFSTIRLPEDEDGSSFALLGWEIPEKLPKAPRKVVREVWG